MKRIMQCSVAALLVGMMAGCVVASGSFSQTEGGSVMSVYADQGFDRYLSVEKGEIVTDSATGRKHANVYVKNVSDRPLRINYAYHWYDADGKYLEGLGFFQGEIDSGITKPILIVTTKKEAVRYDIHLSVQ